MRNFNNWFSGFRSSIANYDYYTDFDKVYRNVDSIKVELNILNSLVGSKDIENDFESIITKYPETLKCIPLLLAVRANEIYAIDGDGECTYDFKNMTLSAEEYKVFMRKTGLFHLIANRIVSNLTQFTKEDFSICITEFGIEIEVNPRSRNLSSGHTDVTGIPYIVLGTVKESENLDSFTTPVKHTLFLS